MGPGSKGQNGDAVVLASIAFGYPNAACQGAPETLCRCAGKEPMRKYNNVVYLRLNDEQLRKLDSLSHLSGNSHNYVLRKLIMGKEIRQRPNLDYREMALEMARLGNNINQYVKKANTLNTISKSDIREVISLMRQVRSLVSPLE